MPGFSGTSQYLPFGTGGSTPNALSFAAYYALTTLRDNGFQPGLAKSEEINTVLRQTSVGVAGVAKFAADWGNLLDADMMDDGNVSEFARRLKQAVSNVVADFKFLQPGFISMGLFTEAPGGWLECNGAIVPRNTYPALFAVIGTTYGAGNGTTTFQLPDFRGYAFRAWDNGRGVDNARVLGSLQDWSTAAPKTTTATHTPTGGALQGPSVSNPSSIGFARITKSGEGSTSAGIDATTFFDNEVDVLNVSAGDAETRMKNFAAMVLIRY